MQYRRPTWRKNIFALPLAVVIATPLFVGLQTQSASAAAIKAGCGKTTEPWFWGNTAHYFVGAPYAKNSPTARVCTPEQVRAAGGNSGIKSYGSGGYTNPTPYADPKKSPGTQASPFAANRSLKAKPLGCKDSSRSPRIWLYTGSKGAGKGWYICDRSQYDDAGTGGSGRMQ